MNKNVHMVPLTESKYGTYVIIGSLAYNQHYRHLWKNGDSLPYIESSFTLKVLQQEECDKNTSLFLISKKDEMVGILKFTIDSKFDAHSAKEALYIDKIYILKDHTGEGIGKKVLQFVLLKAIELGKKLVWLDTMKNGQAIQFYQKNGFAIHSEKTAYFSEILDIEKSMYIMTKEI